MIELSVVRDFIAIFGVIAGFSYYVLTVRNANRSRKQMVARQLAQDLTSLENMQAYIELLEMQWDDYDDYFRKYDSTVNRDNYAKRSTLWGWYDRTGYELYQGNIDVETLSNLLPFQSVWMFWNKFKPVILEYRRRYGYPDNLRWFEYLYNELEKERIRQGLPTVFKDIDGYVTN